MVFLVKLKLSAVGQEVHSGLLEDRYYATRGLYDAPDQKTYDKRVFDEKETVMPELKPQLGTWKIAWTLRKPGRLEPLNGRLWRTRNSEERSSKRVIDKAW
jgi:hypothetical protein